MVGLRKLWCLVRARYAIALAYALTGLLVLVLTAAAYYENSERRRGWEKYQQAAFAAEISKLERDLSALRSRADLKSKPVFEVGSPASAILSYEKRVVRLTEELNREREKLRRIRGRLDRQYAILRTRRLSANTVPETVSIHGLKDEITSLESEHSALEVSIGKRRDELRSAEQMLHQAASTQAGVESADPVHFAIQARIDTLRSGEPNLRERRRPDGRIETCGTCHPQIDRCGFSLPREIVEKIDAGVSVQKTADLHCIPLQIASTYFEVAEALCPTDPDPIELPEQGDIGDEEGDGEDLQTPLAARECLQPAEAAKIGAIASEYCSKSRRATFDGGSRNSHCASPEAIAFLRAAVARADFDLPRWARTHPERDRLLLDTSHRRDVVGCTDCHVGIRAAMQGAVPDVFMADYAAATTQSKGGDGNAPNLPTMEFVESNCSACHETGPLAQAPSLTAGRRLFRGLGCNGCHPLNGFNRDRYPGPDLRRVGEKVHPGYLLQWIKHPREIAPRARMPAVWTFAIAKGGRPASHAAQLELERDALAIATYLWAESPRVNEANLEMGDALKGASLFSTLGCRGCHVNERGSAARPMAGSDQRDFAPELGNIGNKVGAAWLLQWLRDPRSYWRDARMPSLRLSGAEARDLASYLVNQKREPAYESKNALDERLDSTRVRATAGKVAIRKWGCFNCHEIRGFERMHQMGADLDGFGDKPSEDLDFGDVKLPLGQRTWFRWTDIKLRTPDAYIYERAGARMPQFELSNGEVRDLLVFLRSLKREIGDRQVNRCEDDCDRMKVLARSRDLIADFGCGNCHEHEGADRLIADQYFGAREDVPFDPDLDKQAPPRLRQYGARTQASWAYGYLNAPYAIRPWMLARMPTFPFRSGSATTTNGRHRAEDEAESVVEFFRTEVARGVPRFERNEEPPERGLQKQTVDLIRSLRCNGCHVIAGLPEPRHRKFFAPDLRALRKRLRLTWVLRWLANPQSIEPGTRMPAYFVEYGPGEFLTASKGHFGGDAVRQMNAIAVYLLSVPGDSGKR